MNTHFVINLQIAVLVWSSGRHYAYSFNSVPAVVSAKNFCLRHSFNSKNSCSMSIEKGEFLGSRDEFLASLADGISAKFRVVAFDMDQCIVSAHSRGQLLRQDLPSFLSKVSPDFVDLVPYLASRNLCLCVATHSDEAEYTDLINPSTHIMGEELVRSVLESAVPSHADRFEIIAYNPYVRQHILLLVMPHMLAKKHHIREVPRRPPTGSPPRHPRPFRQARRRFKLQPEDAVLLFDDDVLNTLIVEDGCVAVKVLPATRVPAQTGH